jgi:hypothetical protein
VLLKCRLKFQPSKKSKKKSNNRCHLRQKCSTLKAADELVGSQSEVARLKGLLAEAKQKLALQTEVVKQNSAEELAESQDEVTRLKGLLEEAVSDNRVLKTQLSEVISLSKLVERYLWVNKPTSTSSSSHCDLSKQSKK